LTRQRNPSTLPATSSRFPSTDGAGDGTATFASTPHPRPYAVQSHLREGGSPGCPVPNSNAVYRTGTTFAAHLSRFTVPAAVSFWSGDEGPNDDFGNNDATTNGTVGARAGHFRTGFDLDGSSYLSVAGP